MAHDRPWTIRRPLRDDERRLIRALLPDAPAPAGNGFERLDGLEVIGLCRCGCPSIDLGRPDDGSDPAAAPTRIVAQADASSPEGVPVGVILWGQDGRLTGLEVHAWDATTSFGLPLPETLSNLRN